jgi:4-hydroxy-2-oxoglutarate aldolase
VRHYTEIADVSTAPVLLYQFPALTGISLEASSVSVLAEHTNIIGMKDSSGDILQITDYIANGPRFSCIHRSSSTFFTAVCLGAAGGILALSCLLPELCVRLFELARERRQEEGRALQQRLLPVAKLIGSLYGVPGLKAALTLVGIDVGPPRRPLAPHPKLTIAALREELSALEEQPA